MYENVLDVFRGYGRFRFAVFFSDSFVKQCAT